jgi:hypothetical protein
MALDQQRRSTDILEVKLDQMQIEFVGLKEWLGRIEKKIDLQRDDLVSITAYGCAKAKQHDADSERIRVLENSQAENRGRDRAVGAGIAAAFSAAAVLIGRCFR